MTSFKDKSEVKFNEQFQTSHSINYLVENLQMQHSIFNKCNKLLNLIYSFYEIMS